MKILADRVEVEDLLHDVFVEVWQKASSYDPARGTVRSWLCLRMRSRALDRARLSRRTQVESLSTSESAQRKVEASASTEAAPQMIRQDRLFVALRELPEPQRQVISLAYFRGLTCTEIADSLEVPLGTVKSRLAGARKGLERAINSPTGVPA